MILIPASLHVRAISFSMWAPWLSNSLKPEAKITTALTPFFAQSLTASNTLKEGSDITAKSISSGTSRMFGYVLYSPTVSAFGFMG